MASMYGKYTVDIYLFTYISHKNQPNVRKYTIHGLYGYGVFHLHEKKNPVDYDHTSIHT